MVVYKHRDKQRAPSVSNRKKKKGEKMSCTRAWKIYGAEGHRNKESFNRSYQYNFSENGNERVVVVFNSDYTGTNEYNIIEITRNTFDECYEELMAQIDDGIYENCRIGKVEEILVWTSSRQGTISQMKELHSIKRENALKHTV